jgi:hypothetical protein
MSRPNSVQQADVSVATGDPMAFAGSRPACGAMVAAMVETGPQPLPVPRDPDTLEMFERDDQPAPASESNPSTREGAECAGGDAWDGDPSRIVLGQAAI